MATSPARPLMQELESAHNYSSSALSSSASSLAAVIQQLTAYFTETNRRPVDDVAKTSMTGPATVILSGVSLGLESAVYTALVIGAAVYGAFLLGSGIIGLSLFAIALAGTGLLTTVGVIVSMDHLRSGVGQRAGHRGDVRRCGG